MRIGILCVILFLTVLICFAADEISYTIDLEATKNALVITRSPGSVSVNMIGSSMSDVVQTFPVNVTTLVTIASSVTNYGIAMFEVVTTNAGRRIQLGRLNGTEWYPMLELKTDVDTPEKALVRLCDTNGIYAVALVSNVTMRTLIIGE